jgi:adenylate cyclase
MVESSGSILANLISEARRRHVFRAAGLYAGAAFVILQVADILMPTFGLDDVTISYLLGAMALGFPLTLVATWLVDLTPEGIKITPGLEPGTKAPRGRLIDLVIVLIALGVGFMYLERFWPEAVTGNEQVGTGEAELTSDPSPVVLEPSIAVLPFENLSDSKDNAYFAKGIHEDILNHLSQNPALIVTSRTSTLSYTGDSKPPLSQIGRELNVSYVLEGSVRRVKDKVRITMQLINAVEDSHVWSQNYDRDLDDIFAIQDEVAKQVADTLEVQFDLISEGRPTESLQAYEYFLQARDLANSLDNNNLSRAIELYDKALKIDPLYAEAWAGMSIALASPQFTRMNRQESDVRARETAEQAIALKPDSWLSNFAMASYYTLDSLYDFGNAIPYFDKAVAGNPSDALLRTFYGFALFQSGRSDLAAQQFTESYRRNPLSAESNVARAYVAVTNQDHDAARNYLRRAIELDNRRSFVYFFSGMASLGMDELVASAGYFAKALEIDSQHLPSTYTLAYFIFTRLGDNDTAEYWLQKAEKIDPYSTQVNWRRAELLYAEGRLEDYIKYIEDWVERVPGNNLAQRWEGYVPLRRAKLAWDNEDSVAFRKYNQEALALNVGYIENNSPEGEDLVRQWSSWNFLRAGMHSRLEGNDSEADKYYQAIIDHHESQPEGGNNQSHLQMAIAAAGLGRNTEAIDHLKVLLAIGHTETYLLHSYYVIGDPYGVYSDINKDIGFIDVIGRMEANNQKVLEDIRRELPQLFPDAESSRL